MRKHRPHIPCICCVNKIDGEKSATMKFMNNRKTLNLSIIVTDFTENMEVTKKSFAFCTKNSIPLHYVSASDGTNVVKVKQFA